MSPDRLRPLALGTALLAVVGVLLVGVEVATAPEPRGDGLPAAFGAAFALLFLASALATLAEAGLLWTAARRAGPWSGGLFAAGAGAGALSMVAHAAGTVEFADLATLSVPWVRAWVLFAVAGVVCAGVGTLAAAVEPLDRPQGLALTAGVAVLLALHAGSVALETPAGFYWQVLVFGVACGLLGGTLHAVDPLDRTPVRASLAAFGLLALAVAVWRALAARPFEATQVGLLALAPLWALTATFDGVVGGRTDGVGYS